MSLEILFYSDFPFGYHNTEAEEKMARFAARGYRVHYVEQLGIRNPRPRHLLRALRLLTPARPAPAAPFDVVSPKLLAPRRAPLIATLNRVWLSRQLLAHVEDPRRTVLWLRFPTPELIELMESRPWRAVVYEEVDDHEHGPGMNDRLRRVFRAARDRVLARADVVFAWSEPLRERLAAQHSNVHVASAAVDVDTFARATADVAPEPRLAIYTGAIDFRIDGELIAAVADALPDWRFELVGPVSRDRPAQIPRRPNIALTGEIDPSQVPAALAHTSVCLMPYLNNAFTEMLFPIKLVQYLAAGRPIVGTPLRALAQFDREVAIAGDASSFASAVAAAAREDSPEARARRIELAGGFSWERRIDEMQEAIEAVARSEA